MTMNYAFALVTGDEAFDCALDISVFLCVFDCFA